MKVLRAMVGFIDHGGLHHLDAIYHDGRLWFVPHWLENPLTQTKQPLLIVHIANFHMQEGGAWGDYVENEPISKQIVDGNEKPSEDSRYTVIDTPNIHISTKTT